MTRLRGLAVLLLVAVAAGAAADTALPHQLSFAGKRIDLLAGKVLGDAGDAPRCDHQAGAYWRDQQRPDVVRWARGPGGPRRAEALGFSQAKRRHIIYHTAPYTDGPHLHVVVDAREGRRLLHLDEAPTLLVEDTGGSLIGLLVVDEEKHELRLRDGKTGALRWRTPVPDLWGDSGDVLVAGDRLILTAFHRIATGSLLLSVETATGKLVWKADVEQLNVGHSKYFNDVELTLHGPNVVMHGREAYGCYVQVFDAATGARKLSLIDRR